MKIIFMTIVLLSAIYCQAQIVEWPWGRPCGTWQPQPEDTTAWQTVDTLGRKDHFGEERNWVFDKWKMVPNERWTNLDYTPCGAGYPEILEQYRVCSLTGIRQRRERITRYKYIEPPKSEYERVTDSLYVVSTPTGLSRAYIDTMGHFYFYRPYQIDTLRFGHFHKQGKMRKQ